MPEPISIRPLTTQGAAMKFFGLVMVLALVATPAVAADVTVTINNVRNAQGVVLVAICAKADFMHSHCGWRGRTAAHLGAVSITIRDVPPGRYAAQAFHDENANSRLDRNVLGLPKEGMGVSNNAKMWMGRPKFDDAEFDVGPGGARIAFDLSYRK